jgi:hypothetical protein
MEPNGNNVAFITVAIYAALTYDIISATNSSPQTTEINAGARAETLMKWVKIGLAQAALFVTVGVVLDPKRWPPLLGGGIAGTLLWFQYVHAKNAGLESEGPPTETYQSSQPMEGADEYEQVAG